jgi:hypothetical protein
MSAPVEKMRCPDLFPYVLIPKEEARSEIFFTDIQPIDNDKRANAAQDEILDDLRRETSQLKHENLGVSHPKVTHALSMNPPG